MSELGAAVIALFSGASLPVSDKVEFAAVAFEKRVAKASNERTPRSSITDKD
jgi:hypothetical protein